MDRTNSGYEKNLEAIYFSLASKLNKSKFSYNKISEAMFSWTKRLV